MACESSKKEMKACTRWHVASAEREMMMMMPDEDDGERCCSADMTACSNGMRECAKCEMTSGVLRACGTR